MKTSPCSASAGRGFTLFEVMMSSALAALVMAAVAQFTIGVGRLNFNSVAKLSINRDVRSFTHQLSEAGRTAREYEVYAIRQVANQPDVWERQAAGLSGDVLMLIMAETLPIDHPSLGNTELYYVRRLVVFARVAEMNQPGPVYRYTLDYPAASEPGAVLSNTIDKMALARGMVNRTIPGVNVREVVELSRGLANGNLFVNARTGRSIIVNGEIIHENRARDVTNTYNFTISPRG